MIHFDSDYMEGAHHRVMQRLVETNLEQTPGYGLDKYCESARAKIRQACGDETLDVHFLVGGTQTNSTVIDALLDPTQGVLAAESGHIAGHEAGAIESCGHKVLTLPQHDGKIDANELKAYIDDFYADETHRHMIAPGMLYISFPTEYGSIYTKAELTGIYDVCKTAGIPLFIDGARLGYGLASEACDLTLADIAHLSDIFYIGGTKVGALFGEAVVTRQGLLRNFFSLTKQHGALLAKGRLLGLQFDTLFTDNLYIEISRHAIRMATLLKEGFESKGICLAIDSPTNQLFFNLDNDVLDRLMAKATFSIWGKRGEKTTFVRFVTSWATREEDVLALIHAL